MDFPAVTVSKASKAAWLLLLECQGCLQVHVYTIKKEDYSFMLTEDKTG